MDHAPFDPEPVSNMPQWRNRQRSRLVIGRLVGSNPLWGFRNYHFSWALAAERNGLGIGDFAMLDCTVAITEGWVSG